MYTRLTTHPTEWQVWTVGTPNKLSGGSRDDFLPAPKIGQHSVEILLEAGYPESEIESLIATRTVVDGRIAGDPRSAPEGAR